MKISPPSAQPSFLRLNAGSSSQNENRTDGGKGISERPRPPKPAREITLAALREDGTARLIIRGGFVVGLVLVTFVSFLAYRNTALLVAVEARVARSYALRDQVHAVRSAQRSTFFGLQKYLASARNEDYAVFQNAVAAMRAEARLLRQQAHEVGAAQGSDSDRTYLFVDAEARGLQQIADQRRSPGPPSSLHGNIRKVTVSPFTESAKANKAGSALLDQMDAREALVATNKKSIVRRICDQTLQVTGLGGAVTLGVVLLAFFVVERDLTRRSRTETHLRERETETNQLLQKLSESEERFRMVADTAPVMLYVTDENARAAYLSRPWLEFRGRSESAELGFGWADGIPEKEREAALQNWRDAHTRRVPLRIEYRLRRHDGALRWLLASSVPRFVDKQYVGHIGSAVDITEVKQAEEEMRVLVERQQKSETRLRQVSRQANCLLWEAQVATKTIGPDTLVQTPPMWINREDQTVLFWDLSVLDEAEAFRWLPIAWRPGQTFSDAFDMARYADDRAIIDQIASAAILEGRPGYRNEFRVRLADGSDRWLAEDVHIELQGGSSVPEHWHLVGICTDITDQKRQEERLTRLTTELQRSNEALQDFASIASHDLREPLRKIQMFGGMLQKNVAQSGDGTAERNLERVLAAATRMDALVRDLLAYSRVTSKAAPLALVDLQEVVTEVVGDLEARIVETGGVVGFDGLPRLRADALQMRQLFQNLISNALKFHKPDEMPVVLVQARREMVEGVLHVVVTVSDNGVGFEPEYAERIFNIFERLDSTREGYAGTGVGLAICRKIVQRHGGVICAESEPGFGSTFTIRLPVPRVAAAQYDIPPPENAP